MSHSVPRGAPSNILALLGLIGSLSLPPVGLVLSLMGLQRSYFMGGRGRLVALTGLWISAGWIMLAVFLAWLTVLNELAPGI